MATYRIKRFSRIKEEEKIYSVSSKMMNKLRNNINEKREKVESLMKEYDKKDKVVNPEKEKEIIENEITQQNRALFPKVDKYPMTAEASEKEAIRYEELLKDPIVSLQLSDDDYRFIMLIMKAHKEGKDQIYWESKDGLESLAHEIGHRMNKQSKNYKDKLIHRGAKLGERFKNMDNNVFDALINVLGGEMIVWEEKNASKKGYDLLKNKYHLSGEELRIAKENMDIAIEIYRLQGEINWKYKLANALFKILKKKK